MFPDRHILRTWTHGGHADADLPRSLSISVRHEGSCILMPDKDVVAALLFLRLS
jgi:hypothetical protein